VNIKKEYDLKNYNDIRKEMIESSKKIKNNYNFTLNEIKNNII